MTDAASRPAVAVVAQVTGVQVVLLVAVVAALLAAGALVLLRTRRTAEVIDLGDLTLPEEPVVVPNAGQGADDERAPRVALVSVPAPTHQPLETARWSPAEGDERPSGGDASDDVEPATAHVPTHRGTPPPGVEYAELSRSYAALGRAEDAALAQWAADLRLVRPLIGDHGRDLPERVLAISGRSPVHAVRRARTELLGLVSDSEPGWPAPPMFASLRHVSELPCSDTCTAITTTTTPNQLRDRAADLMARAAEVAAGDPRAARSDARRSDLAALDAVLLESAQLYGDRSLASVELRRQLASVALHDQDQTAGDQPLPHEIARTRAVLRSVVEPHELDRLESSFAPEPTG